MHFISGVSTQRINNEYMLCKQKRRVLLVTNPNNKVTAQSNGTIVLKENLHIRFIKIIVYQLTVGNFSINKSLSKSLLSTFF